MPCGQFDMIDPGPLAQQLQAALAVKQSDNHARDVAKAALTAVIKHLDSIGIAPKLRIPLMDLLAALDDSEAGRKNPLVTPSPRSAQHPKKLAKKIVADGLAAAALTILCASAKWQPKKATDFVSRSLGYKASELANLRKRYAAPQRNRIDGKSNVSDQDLENFEFWMTDFRSRKIADPVAHVVKMIAHARERRGGSI
jgi:hypothetical protein